MIRFFLKYVRQDNIGQVSNAHLALADQLGLANRFCRSVALKHAVAVDFPKTGVRADPLTKQEQAQKFPDFMQKNHKPMYKSERLLGHLYR